MRRAGAVKYDFGADYPGHLQPVAVIELTESDAKPPDIVEYDLTYHATPDEIPPERLSLAAHVYSLTDAIPAMLKRICAVVAALLPVGITDGKSLKFNDRTNSMHLITLGV